MPSYNLKRFSNPKVLKSVAPETLGQFLSPHREFLTQKGFTLPADCSTLSDFDHLSITAILMKPEDGMPPDLTESLYFTHEMGTERMMDKLLDLASRLQLDIPCESTPMDVAMRLWIEDSLALEKAHSEQHIFRSRTFEHYQADASMPFAEPSNGRVEEMEAALDVWFENHKRGANSRVFVYPGEDETWFLIRHGDTYKRESAVEGYASKGVSYRPEAFDVACYSAAIGELRIHTKNKGEQNFYRRELGKLICGDSSFFPGLDKYDLSPLIHDGDKSLVVSDIDGIDWVMLTEIRLEKRRVHYTLSTTHTAPNVLLALRDDNIQLRPNETITKAKLKVKFTGEDKPRFVTITPPNKLQLGRDTDAAVIEVLLRKRGFIKYEEADCGQESEGFLVGV